MYTIDRPSVEECANNTTSTSPTPVSTSTSPLTTKTSTSPAPVTTSSQPTPSVNSIGIVGDYGQVKLFNEKGICNKFAFNPFPSGWKGPVTMAHLSDSIIACGSQTCSGENCQYQFNDCYKFNTTNMEDGWIQISSPYDNPKQYLNFTDGLRFGSSKYFTT